MTFFRIVRTFWILIFNFSLLFSTGGHGRFGTSQFYAQLCKLLNLNLSSNLFHTYSTLDRSVACTAAWCMHQYCFAGTETTTSLTSCPVCATHARVIRTTTVRPSGRSTHLAIVFLPLEAVAVLLFYQR